jgi:hypothetical protein
MLKLVLCSAGITFHKILGPVERHTLASYLILAKNKKAANA